MSISLPSLTKPVQPKEPKMRNKGFFRANYLSSVAALPASAASIGIVAAMKKVSKLSAEDSVVLQQAAKEGLEKTGLAQKGVNIHRFVQTSPKEVLHNIVNFVKNPLESDASSILKFSEADQGALSAMKDEVRSQVEKKLFGNKFYKKLPADTKEYVDNIKDLVVDVSTKSQSLMFKTGLNACYLPNANQIITPDKSLQTSVFHEMGHALNNNGGAVMKMLQKLRPAATVLPGVILLASLLNKRKTTDEKSDNKVQNFFDGVKKHAGKLTAVAMLPMVAEEGIASLRGGAIAKDLVKQGKLSKEILNKVRLTNLCGFASYVLAAAVTVGTAKLAINIKDKIQAKYEDKQMQKYQQKLADYEAKKANA